MEPTATDVSGDPIHLLGKSEMNISATQDLAEKIQAYMADRQPKLYVLTPCFGGTCYVNYIQSMLATLELFRSVQFPIQFEFCQGDSLVTRARNNLVARAMGDPATTHIMFIDNDLTWNPVDILKMVLADQGLVGGIYPLKKYHWGRLKAGTGASGPEPVQDWLAKRDASYLKNVMTDDAMVQSRLLNYNVNYWTPQLQIENNLAKVRHIPTGFMLIQRQTLETLFKAYPETKYVDDVGFLGEKDQPFAYALFDCEVREGHYFSEDWLFCERWMEVGGTVWADVSVILTHTGTEDYRGSYLASLL